MTILELAHQVGIEPKWVASTGGGEYHSACPYCGGSDRFYIQPHKQMNKCLGYYCCRRCGIKGDAIQFAREFLHYSFKEAAEAVHATINENITAYCVKPLRINSYASLQPPPKEWIMQATAFVSKAHERLLSKHNVLKSLEQRGLPLDAVRRYRLGWLDNTQFLSRNDWGLPEQYKSDGRPRSLWIPQGLIIPTIESSRKVMRLKVRRYDWQEGDELPKYIVISGSMNGLTLIGSYKSSIVLVVESELDAYAIDYVAHNDVCIVAVGGCLKNPDNVTNNRAKRASKLIICYDDDEAGHAMLNKWQELYTHAQARVTPQGKDIGEYITMGGDIKTFIQTIANEGVK